MRNLFFLSLMITSLSAAAKKPDVAELRHLYCQLSVSKAAAQRLMEATENLDTGMDPLLQSYKAVALMIRADRAVNPYLKWRFFSEGKKMLDEAVRRAPANAEIRFMRYCVQTNVPFFLNYHHDTEEDKQLIIRSWSVIEPGSLKTQMKHYLLLTGRCSDAEKQILL